MPQTILKNFPFIINPLKNQKTKALKTKALKSIDQLAEFPLHEQLSVIKTDQSFKWYAMSHKVEIIERNCTIRSK